MSLKITNATMARVESSFRQLASAAQALNTASEELSKVIRHLDASLKKLGLGVNAWVPVSGWSDESQYSTIELGYTKLDGKWGLALRQVTGFHLDKNDVSEQTWPYNDAPRDQRAEAVEKIPDLLEKLLRQTEETTRELQLKIEQASEFTSVVSELTPNNAPAAPQQFQRPDVTPMHSAPAAERTAKPGPTAVREPQPLPVERVPSERPSGANAAPQAVTRFSGEDDSKSPAANTHPVPAGRSM